MRKKIKQADASAFLGQLIADVELHRQIHELEYRKWLKSERPAVESLRYFRDFRISQPMPLVLALMREFNASRISLKQLRRGLRAIEDYHFTYNTLASKSSSGGMSLFYGKRARDLLNASDAAQRARQIDDLVAELRGKRPTDAEFDEAFASLWLADGYTTDRKTVRYILARLYEQAREEDWCEKSR